MIAGTIYPDVVPHGLQPMQGLLSPVLVLIIVTLALDRTRLSVALNHSWLVMLGETAYALYILHVPVVWFYRKALETSFTNHEAIFDATFLPLIIVIALVSHLYIDRPLRIWLRNTMTRVSMPLLLLDLAATALSIYLSFSIRFPALTRRELAEIEPIAYTMFWCAFVIRIAVPLIFNGTNPAIVNQSFSQMARPVLLSVTVGSVILGALMLGFVSLGWLTGFPRSVLLFDWGMMLLFSILSRLAFKNLNLYPLVQKPA